MLRTGHLDDFRENANQLVKQLYIIMYNEKFTHRNKLCTYIIMYWYYYIVNVFIPTILFFHVYYHCGSHNIFQSYQLLSCPFSSV